MRFVSTFLILAFLGVAAASPHAAHAQDARERAEFALGVTDQRIELAARLASESGNQQAQLDVQAAQDLQARAKSAFAAAQYALTMRLTLDARARADHAIALVRGLPDPERIAAQLERTREILDRAQERMAECSIDRARAMLRVALDMQLRAERAFDADLPRYLAALQLTTGARERGLRALRICQLEASHEENADRALQRTDEVIARVRDHLSQTENEAARRALRRAVELQENAWAHYRSGRAEAALQATLSARAFAHRALRAAGERR